MVGSGPVVFALWGYILSNTRDSHVEINPVILATILGCTTAEVQEGLDYLLAPDPSSRTKEKEGRRLIQTGEFSYFVVTYEKYRAIRNEEDRRDYMRQYMRDYRAKDASVNTSKQCKPPLAHSDTDADTDSEIKPLSGKPDIVGKEIIEYLNAKTGSKFQPVESNLKMIRARIKEGHSGETIKLVIDDKVLEWKGTSKAQYLRPATLFNAEKFNQYVGQVGMEKGNEEHRTTGKKLSAVERVRLANGFNADGSQREAHISIVDAND